ncbi:hypothetical protein N431DRAFT_432333 [Stipitochalara longipes BDJ]|nr:hypothetical protein N431DRAFT_432333 [Stipitochalara longipes BDJ]
MITRLPAGVRALSQTSRFGLIYRPSGRCLSLSRQASPFSRRLLPQHNRQYATESTPPPTEPRPTDLRSQFSSPPPPQPSVQPRPKRSLRPYIYAAVFFIIGLTAGQYVRLVLAPPALPPAGSKEDLLMVTFLQKQAEKLPIVQSLSTDPAWTTYEAYSSVPAAELPHRLTTGPLGGARAIGGFQRVFWNEESGEIVTVIWFGGAIAGWPGVTHGGVTATIMDEILGRCAIRQFPTKTGVTANLELNYLKPVVTNSFYVVRAVPEKGFTERKCWISGRLETVDGRVCVEAKGLFVVPKGLSLKTLGDNF